MSNLAYSFDLTSADYVAMNLDAQSGIRSYLRAAFPLSAALGLVLLLLLGTARNRDFGSVVLIAAAATIFSFVVQALMWKYNLRRYLLKYYAQSPRDRLFGAHTLAIGDEGIESTGPHHRTFRAWPAITQARFTTDRLFLHTIFGNVYVLPLKAVSNRDELQGALAAHLPSNAFRNA